MDRPTIHLTETVPDLSREWQVGPPGVGRNGVQAVAFIQELDGRIHWIDQGAARDLGWPQAFVEGDPEAWLNSLDPCEKPHLLQTLAALHGMCAPGQFSYHLVNGGQRTIPVADYRWPSGGTDQPPRYHGFWIDMGEQKSAEKRLLTHGWSEALHTITSGLLHDFGNTISGIFSLAEVYHRRLAADDPLKAGLAQIRDNAHQTYLIIRRILSLYREETGTRRSLLLGAALFEQSELLRAILPKNIKLEFELETCPHPVQVDEVAFRQSLINLLVNARDAIQPNGRITVALRYPHRPERHALTRFAVPPAPDREYVELEVRDDGLGISPERLPRLFTPYYTTKAGGAGSGLGLYNIRRFAENHGGALGVSSQPGQGTSFFLLLPLAPLSIPAADPVAPSPAEPARERHMLIVCRVGLPNDDRLENLLREDGWWLRSVGRVQDVRRLLRHSPREADCLLVQADFSTEALQAQLAELRRENPGLRIALQFTCPGQAPAGPALRDTVSLLLEQEDRLETVSRKLRQLLQP